MNTNDNNGQEEDPRILYKSLRRTLTRSRTVISRPLDGDFVRRFNAFVDRHPNGLSWKGENGGQTLLEVLFDYLDFAIRNKLPLNTFEGLVARAPQVLLVRNAFGWTLVHSVCLSNPSAVDVISFFLEQCPRGARVRSRNMKGTPLHMACYGKAPLPVIRALLRAYPRALRMGDAGGNTPLHDVCCHGASLEVIRYLVAEQPHVCLLPNRSGMLPLDCANHPFYRCHDVIATMTVATRAAAGAVLERGALAFCGPAPREIFRLVASYLVDTTNQNVPCAAEVAMINLSLSPVEIAVLFQRDSVQREFRLRALPRTKDRC